MAILIGNETRVLVQGITGAVGRFQSQIMKKYGTKIVAGVTPGRGGQQVDGIPVYDLVEEAVAEHEVDAAISFVPARSARDAGMEILSNGIRFLVLTASGVPDHDVMLLIRYAELQGSLILGPDTPGLISPGKSKLGVHPDFMFTEGPMGIVSKSGSLSYEVGRLLTEAGIGQSTVVGIGGGPIWGVSQEAVLERFEQDPHTRAVVLLGEVGGRLEQDAAFFIQDRMTKPVIALIVGRAAPEEAQMGHAGAIVEGEEGTATSKNRALQQAGAHIAKTPADIPRIVQNIGVL
jgi:succinyl-CoA synthetase alpha subunit